MSVLVASEHISTGWPVDEGKTLAQAALEVGLEGLSIDVRNIVPGMFVASFFNSFLQEIYDQGGEDQLSLARGARWIFSYHAQWEKSEWIILNFQPREQEEE